MFSCKSCVAKDKHISDLNRQLSTTSALLEKIVAPTYYQPVITRQANIALDGAGYEQEPDQEQDQPKKEISPIELQAQQMLTGNY